MKLSISKAQFLLGLQRVQNVVERRTTMPILSNALFKTMDNQLVVSATDLEIGIESHLKAEVLEPGAITLRGRNLLDIVRELPDTFIYIKSRENNRIELSAGKYVVNIVGLPAEDYPEIPGLNDFDESHFVRMNGTAVLSMLDKTLYAASTDESRYHLNGVFFETFEQKSKRYFRMVATDAHRLSLVDSSEALFDEKAWGLFKQGVIVPRKGLSELRRLLSEGKEDFFITIKGKILFVKRDNIVLSMRVIDGKYADYRRIIPDESDRAILLDKNEFLASLKRISLITTDKSRSVTFNVTPGTLHLFSQSPELGEANEEIGIQYQGEEFKIGFNSRYLIDALTAVDSESIAVELKDKQNPGVIRSGGTNKHISVVMPMRI